MNFKLIESEIFKGYYFCYFSNNYLVNREGKVITIDGKEPYIRTDTTNDRVYLVIENQKITITLSRLICMTFNFDNYFKNACVSFIDGNKKNVSAENLIWISHKDIQTNRVISQIDKDIKDFNIPTTFIKKRGLYPNPIDCKFKKNYYYIPFSTSPIVINKNGELFNLKTKENIYPFNSIKNYDLVVLRYGRKFKSTALHRIVALLFCEIPNKHIEKDIDKLQVNHIDGNKKNNKFTNLEWCDGFENMQHARLNGLFSNQSSILTKNIKTGEIKKYYSISECARQHGFHHGVLFFHLKSKSASRIPYNNVLFKLDDGSDWPKILLHEKAVETTFLSRNCDVIALNVETGEKHLFYSICQGCIILGLDVVSVRNHRQRIGHDIPFKNYIFYYIKEDE